MLSLAHVPRFVTIMLVDYGTARDELSLIQARQLHECQSSLSSHYNMLQTEIKHWKLCLPSIDVNAIRGSTKPRCPFSAGAPLMTGLLLKEEVLKAGVRESCLPGDSAGTGLDGSGFGLAVEDEDSKGPVLSCCFRFCGAADHKWGNQGIGQNGGMSRPMRKGDRVGAPGQKPASRKGRYRDGTSWGVKWLHVLSGLLGGDSMLNNNHAWRVNS